jgi:hypothetical protein
MRATPCQLGRAAGGKPLPSLCSGTGAPVVRAVSGPPDER